MQVDESLGTKNIRIYTYRIGLRIATFHKLEMYEAPLWTKVKSTA